MSSQNSSNEFEDLDEMLSDADGAPFGTAADDPFGDGVMLDDLSPEEPAPTGEEGFVPEGADATTPAEEEISFTEDTTADESAPVADLEQPAQYKKVHCWDMYSLLLFVAWLALLGGILILYFECSPYEYGNPPYKEGSTPIKAAP